MNIRLLFIFPAIFFLSLSSVYSQSVQTEEQNKNFIKSLTSAGLKEETIDKIKLLLSQKAETNLKNQKLQASLEAKYPVQFQDDEITEQYTNKKFLLDLSKIITIDQFGKIFFPQLEYRIDRIAAEKWELAKEKYKLAKDQEKKFRDLLYKNTQKEIMVREYYSYDKDLSWNTYTEEKIKSSDKERELLKSFGLFYSKNTKTDTLIKKLKDANIDPDRINQILLAVQIEQERQDKREKTWRENQINYVVHFHDEGDVEDKIRMDLRAELGKILKIEEFKTVFVSQMQNRIIRNTEKEFQTIKAAYKLTDAQYDEIHKLVLEKNTEKVVTEEYYKYSYELYQQKLRAVEYRHEKNIRETIQKFNTPKP